MMKGRFWESRKLALVALVSLLLLISCPAPVTAISVMGAKYLNGISPGGTDIHTMTVGIGPDQNPTDVQIDVMGFAQSLDKSYITLDPASDLSPYSGRSFITLSTAAIHLEPGKSQDVKATIKIPPDVGSGGRYAIISVHALANKGESFTTGVSVPVFITIAGTKPAESGKIQKVDTGNVMIGQPITITTTFTNTGNIHYYHTINKVSISDSKGNMIANISTQPSTLAIIPGSTVQFVAMPEIGTLETGTYTLHSVISLEDGRILDEKTTPLEISKSYSPPMTESDITLVPSSPAILKSPDGRFSVIFPQGSVLGPVKITLKPYSREMLRAAPAGAKLGSTSFEIAGLSGLLNKDATIRVRYSADDLGAASGDTSLLKLAYYDTAQSAWVVLPTQVNTQDSSLTSNTNHLGVTAVMVSSSAGTAIPAVKPTQAPLPAFLSPAALVLVMLGLWSSTRRKI